MDKVADVTVALDDGYVEVGGLRLHVVQAGPAEGPLVVLLHGFPEFWGGWRRQIGPLAQAGLRVAAPDQRGYNLSARPQGVAAYDVAHLVEDIAGLVTALGRSQAYIVGHDWGAVVAWELALRHPEMVAKLAILNVPHPDVMMRFLLGSLAQVRKSWYIFFFQLPGLPEYLLGRKNFAAMRRMLRGSGRRGRFSEEDLQAYCQAWGQAGALTAMINWYRAIFRSGLRGPKNPARVQPRRVTVPTLMLWGKQDIALGAEMAQPSIDLCTDGRLVFFENATHWVQHDEAEAINRLLMEFLRVD